MEAFHLIGIKGSGMSALAQILSDVGYSVQGSNVENAYFTQLPLENRGIAIHRFREENVHAGLTTIASNAFPDSHVEVAKAKKETRFYRYHEYLAKLISDHASVAVSGTHGKTTTTGMLAHVFSGITPTSYLIGDGTGVAVANSEYFAL